MISLQPITPDNYQAAALLSVKEGQMHFVATVTQSLADAYVWQDSIFRLAYADDVLVGYLLLFPYIQKEQQFVNIVRLMIDQHHQGRGLGRQLLEAALTTVQTLEPAVNCVRISTLAENQVALNLYRSAGFIEAGVEEGEIALYREMRKQDLP